MLNFNRCKILSVFIFCVFSAIPFILVGTSGASEMLNRQLRSTIIDGDMINGEVMVGGIPTGDLPEIKVLIKQGADINVKDEDGNTLLILALEYDYMRKIEVVKYLVDNGVNINATNLRGDTALRMASEYRHTEAVKYLVDNGADTTKMTIQDWVNSGWLLKIKELVESGIDLNSRDEEGRTLLNIAALQGHAEVVKYLVEKGADTTNMTIQNWARYGYLQKIKEMVERGVDLNSLDEEKQTALEVASENGHLEIVKYLVDNGADINGDDGVGGQAALSLAAGAGHLEIVKYLVAKGVDINTLGRANNMPHGSYTSLFTVVMQASNGGHLEVVKYLVEKGADINVIEERYGSTALSIAAGKGHLKVVKYLVENGADIDVLYDNISTTALMEASSAGHLKVVKYLAENGADIHLQEEFWGITALGQAARDGQAEVVEYLLGKGAHIDDKNKALWWALGDKELKDSGYLDVAKQLVKSGADITASNALIKANRSHPEILKYLVEHLVKNGGHEIAVRHAAEKGHLDILKYLVEKGADINAKDVNGNTALMKAAQGEHSEVVQYLLDKGADVNVENKEYGHTSLMDAAQNGRIEDVISLVEGGADMNIENTKHGFTALNVAARMGEMEIVKYLVESEAEINTKQPALMNVSYAKGVGLFKYLVEHGADINARDEDGRTPLMTEPIEAVKYLVEEGADIQAKDNQGRTALMWASHKTHDASYKILKYLVEIGVDINAQDNDGHTALMFAANHVYINADKVKYLIEKGADIHSENNKGFTVIDFAKSFTDVDSAKDLAKQKEIVEYLETIGAKEGPNTLLLRAASVGNISQVTRCINQGADVNIRSTSGYTALMWASAKGHGEVVQYLIEHGVDMNAKDSEQGATALIWASMLGPLEIVTFLVKNGADINIQDNNGFTALMDAAARGRIEIVKYLLANGADMNIKEKNGHTTLRLLQCMVENNLHIDVAHGVAHTALPQISDGGVIEDILAKGAVMINSVSSHILKEKQREVLNYLIENSADTNTKDGVDKTTSREPSTFKYASGIRQGTSEIQSAMSEILTGDDYNLVFHFTDDYDIPYEHTEYTAYFDDGTTKKGITDEDGYTQTFYSSSSENVSIELHY